jgi:Protein of unknown function (DUF1559)
LQQIGFALLNYQEAHGRLPPAVVQGKDGKPLLSWRVLILPYLGEDKLYRQFRLDEAWDGPHNKSLLSSMPKTFAPPRVVGRTWEPETTFYQVLTGPGTAFDGAQGMRLPQDFPDGTANTLLVVEAAEAVPWTQPTDLPFDKNKPFPRLGGIFNSEGRFSLFGSNREIGFNVLLGDGSVRFMDPSVSESSLRALATRNGSDSPGTDW